MQKQEQQLKRDMQEVQKTIFWIAVLIVTAAIMLILMI